MSGYGASIARLAAAFLLCAAPLLAGDVSVVIKGGTLVLTGGDGVEELTFLTESLVDDGGQLVAVQPAPGTSLNGATLTAIFQGIKAIKIDLGAGDDSVTMQSFDFAGPLTLRGGGGTDSVTTQSSHLGPTKILQSEGRLLADLSGTSFSKNLVIVGGSGDDDVAFLLVDVAGKLVIHLGDGNDALDLADIEVTGNATLDLSVDDNTLTSNLAHFAQHATVKGGPGTDTITFTDADFTRTLRLLLDTGPNVVTLSTLLADFAAHEDVLIKTGDQDDTVNLTPPSGSVLVSGTLKLQLGPGDNAVHTSGDVTLGALQLTDGAGDGTVTLGGPTIHGDVRLTLAGGNNAVTLDDATLHGDLRITAGAGDDTVQFLGSTSVTGEQKIKLGGGNNTQP